MKTLIYFSLLLSMSAHAQGLFQKLYHGYLGADETKLQEFTAKLNLENKSYQLAQNQWQFNVSAQQDQSDLAALFSLNAQKTTTQTANLGISKQSFDYGSFSFTHSESFIDVSEWENTSFLPAQSDFLYEVRNTLGYQYDFLDRSTSFQKKIIEKEYELNQKRTSLDTLQKKWRFYQTYVKAKNDWFNLQLQKEVLESYKKRVRRLTRRVQDGLSRRVDLLQAKSLALNQEETLYNQELTFKKSVHILEEALNMQIGLDYFEGLIWELHDYSYYEALLSKELPKNQIELDVLNNQDYLLMVQQKRMEEMDDWKLQLKADFISNSVSDDTSEARDGAFDTSVNTSKVVALNFIIPFGEGRDETRRRRFQAEKSKLEVEKRLKVSELNVRKKDLVKQLLILQERLEISKEKIVLAEKTFKEQSRLYDKGIASFEDVIRAEESLVTARLLEKGLLSLWDLSYAEINYLHNQLESFLEKYQG